MFLSNGSVSMQEARRMTRAEARRWALAFAPYHGLEVDWKRGTVKAPDFEK